MPQTRRKIKKIIEQYKTILKTLGIHAQRVILYGSFAKGNPREDSDIDIVVVSNDFKKLNLRERIEVLGIASARIKEPIEARGYTPSEIKKSTPLNFLNEILKVGITL